MGKVLVTGGAGFVGTHILCVLSGAGRQTISIDNYVNSSPTAIERVRNISAGGIDALEVDIRNASALRKLVREHDIDSVIHLAGLKSVSESVEHPQRYHDNNVTGTANLLDALTDSPVRTFIFSSSATVYGIPDVVPIDEKAPTAPRSPYGENKLTIERLLAQLAGNDTSWRIVNLRYFNPVGAHESGAIGEDPRGIPSNLMPYVCQTAAGRREALRIFGRDYPTPDGTGIRDFIHVMDLAEGHAAALLTAEAARGGTVMTVNLGTGRGTSVLELVRTFERINRIAVPFDFSERRLGDIAVCYADCSLARELFGWSAQRGLENMCRDAWRWQQRNPDGYR